MVRVTAADIRETPLRCVEASQSSLTAPPSNDAAARLNTGHRGPRSRTGQEVRERTLTKTWHESAQRVRNNH